MRRLIVEFLTCGGWERAYPLDPGPLSLRREGLAMALAAAADAAALGPAAEPGESTGAAAEPGESTGAAACPRGTTVVPCLPELAAEIAAVAGVTPLPIESPAAFDRLFDRLPAEFDATLLIAPESDGLLEELSARIDRAGGRRLGPAAPLLRLAADKNRTCDFLAAAGVPVPHGRAVPSNGPWPTDVPLPAVLKPADGCGSQNTFLLRTAAEVRNVQAWPAFAARLEAYRPGLPASVVCLCGSAGIFPLAPCRQTLADDGTFAYLGGELPVGAELAARATRLAVRAVAALPRPIGWLGVDLILGADRQGTGDVVIEINPRPTTSWVGLRAHYVTNLFGLLERACRGATPPPLLRRPGGVRFFPDGRVVRM